MTPPPTPSQPSPSRDDVLGLFQELDALACPRVWEAPKDGGPCFYCGEPMPKHLDGCSWMILLAQLDYAKKAYRPAPALAPSVEDAIVLLEREVASQGACDGVGNVCQIDHDGRISAARTALRLAIARSSASLIAVGAQVTLGKVSADDRSRVTSLAPSVEEAINILADMAATQEHSETITDLDVEVQKSRVLAALSATVARAVSEERERCAKVAEVIGARYRASEKRGLREGEKIRARADGWLSCGANECRDAIRALGSAGEAKAVPDVCSDEGDVPRP